MTPTAELRRVWELVTPEDRSRAVWVMALVVLMALLETAGVLSIVPFLTVISRLDAIGEKPWLQAIYDAMGFEDPVSFAFALGVMTIAFVSFSSGIKVFVQHALNRFVHLQRHSISSRLLRHYLRQPYSFFLQRNSADLAKSILSESDQLVFNLMQPLAQMVSQAAVVVAVVILMVVFDPLIALFAILMVGSLYALVYAAVRKRLARIGAGRMQANRERYQACNEVLSGIKVVKVSQAVPAYMGRFDAASRQYSRNLAASDTLSQTPLYLVEAVGCCCLIIVALVLLSRSNDVAGVLPALGLYGFATYRILPAAQIMYRGFAKLRFSSAALAAIHADLTAEAEEAAASQWGKALVPAHSIRLQDIGFTYPGAAKPAFRGLGLEIPVGASIGIVGESGAGKSTLMDLLLGLLDPEEGVLLVDGKPVGGADVLAWQRSVGYVPQEVFLMDATIAENIALGVPPDHVDMERLQEAARIAQIHEFIVRELPEGYQTFVGERGTRLSGGQRQRLGIARALYRDPPVLLLDEATSALDPETELRVLDGLLQSSSGRTIISISHNRASLAGFDRVVDVAGLSGRGG